MNFQKFETDVADLGLMASMRDITHWQILQGGSPLVDYWPTIGKFRRSKAESGTKATRGTVADVLALARSIASVDRSMKPAGFYASPTATEALKHFPPEFVSLLGHALCGLAARYGDTKKPSELSGMAFALAEWTLDEMRDACPRKMLDDPAAVAFDPLARNVSGVRSFC